MKKEMMKKPDHTIISSVWFMVKLAWTTAEKKVLILGFLSAVLAVLLNLLNLYVLPVILGAIERHAPIAELLAIIVSSILGMMVLSAASMYVDSNVLFGRVTVRSEIVTLLNRKANTTSYSNLDDERFQTLFTKANECVFSNASSGEAIWKTLTELTKNLIGFVIYVSLLTTVEPLLFLAVLVTTGISYFIGNRLNSYGYRHRDEEAEYEKHMKYFSDCAKDLGAAKDIRIFGMRPWLESLYDKAMAAYTAFHQKAESVYLWAKIADLILTFLRNALAYAFLIHEVLQNGLGIADFLLFFSAVGGFTEWVTGILTDCNTLYKQSLDLSNVLEFLHYPEPFRFEDGSPLKPDPGMAYEIRLEHVSFRYPGADKNTLTDIDLTLHPGEKLAIVGSNGAGKTTLVKLICGFLDPTEGRVLLNGTDIRELNRTDYYTMFSAVFQDFSLLAGTIAANVAQTEDHIDLDRVKTCVEKAGLRDKIERLSNGYETCLNREVYEDAILFSGGETQRLMLARALYKDAPFIVLDEPTAALDPIAESELYQKYNDITNGRSSVYISHRLASTRFCDRILLIDQAKICEEGTHEELMAYGGTYAKLYDVQSRYYREGVSEHEEQQADALA